MLKVKNIETWYDLVRALHGISLEIKEGEVVALLGSNGAGKTTTLKSIMRLLDDDNQPEKGSIEFLGTRIDRLDTEQIVRMGISLVPEGREIFPELTVVENISMGAVTRKDWREIKKEIEKYSTKFPILNIRRNQEAGYLSGGEQQMLAIVRGLMSRPKLLMLDEPSLGLSPLLVKQVFNVLKDINNEGITILLVEQNANVALKYSQYGFLMENGRIVRAGRSVELREDEDIKEFYLGIKKEVSVKGYQRYRRKVRFR